MQLYIRDRYDKSKYIDANADIILAKGGDGTLLKAITKFRHLDKPFFGIAAGTENFLMNNTFSKPEELIFPNAKFKKFRLLKVKISRLVAGLATAERVHTYQAFNDVMIGGDMNSWINFNVHDKDHIVGEFKGGGLILSTAQGSTGINKNNGGVILPLSSHNWVVTGDKTSRPINYVLKSSRISIHCSSRRPVTVWIDGQNHIITDVTKVEITTGNTVTVIFNDYDNFKRKRKI